MLPSSDSIYSNITVNLNIPSTKVMAAASMVMEEYQPIVEEALREARSELYKDSDFYNSIKCAIKQKVKSVVEQSIDATITKVVNNVYNLKREKIEHAVLTSLFEDLDPNCMNNTY